MSFLKNTRISRIGWAFVMALLVAGGLFSVSSLITINNISTIKTTWNAFEDSRSEKAAALSALRKEIGYGGMIHQFKNFVLRHDVDRIGMVNAKLGGAASAIARYRALDLNIAEAGAISDIEKMLKAYSKALTLAAELAAQGKNQGEIDAQVRVDDTAAIQGLDTLDIEVSRIAGIRAANPSKFQAVANLRKAMGYGGMIHNFKDMVLRHNHVIKDRTNKDIGEALSVIKLYSERPLSEVEQQALRDIAGVINAYEAALAKVDTLAEQGQSPAAIDRVVRIDDAPAFKGFDTLTREISRQNGVKAAKVHTALGLVVSAAKTIDLVVLTIIFLLAFASLWLVRRQVTGPIARMTDVMSRLAAGNLDQEVPGKDQTNEIGQMARAIEIFRNTALDRKKGEQSLRDREQRMSAILNNVVDGIVTIDKKGTIETFNPAAEMIFGYASFEVIGKNVKCLMPEPYHGEHDGYLKNYNDTGEAKIIGSGREVIGQRKDGSTFPMELAVSDMNVSGVRMFTGIVRDITERKQAEQSLRDREQRMSAILNNVVDGIVTIDKKGTIETFNPAAEMIFGYASYEVIGKNVKCLMPEPYHGEHDGYLQNYHDTGEAKIIGTGREVIGQRKDGSTFPMELAVSAMDVSGVQMFTGIVRDITDRKQADLAKAEFVSTVSHELRTPLTSIKGSLGLIRSGALGALPDKLGSMLNIAYNNSERLVLLINDILDMEKIQAGKMDFHMQAIEVASLLKSAMEANKGYGDEHGVTFGCECFDDTIKVLGDKDRLMQVLSNLMSNAAKFSPEGEQVDLSVARRGDTIRMSVKDSGPGIPEEFRKSIFEKFSQADSSDTRQKGGTGLGLSISKAIVEQHGGSIGFDTVTGKGATFYVDLSEFAEQAEILPPEAGEGGRYRILICEDDVEIATILEQMLGYAGYRTRTARTAAQAKNLLQELDFDAMTLDLGLPDQNGISLLQELRSHPRTLDLPIIVISATAMEGKQELNGDAINIIDWIEKPFDTQGLIDRLGEAIKRPAGARVRILHVEDDDSILEIIATLIADTADIVSATTISKARMLLQHEVFDLVILDLTLPDGDGETLLPLLNKAGAPSTPVIIFSAREVSRDVAKTINAALVKSQTSNEDLLNTIRATIEARKLGD